MVENLSESELGCFDSRIKGWKIVMRLIRFGGREVVRGVCFRMCSLWR